MLEISAGLAILIFGLLVFSFFKRSIFIYLALVVMCVGMIFSLVTENDSYAVKFEVDSGYGLWETDSSGWTDVSVFMDVAHYEADNGSHYLWQFYPGGHGNGLTRYSGDYLRLWSETTDSDISVVYYTSSWYDEGSYTEMDCVVDQTNDDKSIYFNGILVDYDSTLIDDTWDFDNDLYINNGGYSGKNPLIVKEFRVYSEAFTDEEIYDYRINGIGLNDNNLEIWYRFTEGEGDTLYDYSGNDRDMTLGGNYEWLRVNADESNPAGVYWQIVFSIIMLWAILNLFKRDNWQI